ncbi:MAG TPA: efflux RND transporter periplasmic adaptor subunit, partial [Mobilitalea sp.]|nr:efflux RND transporter periplasmic adaptor subunit [Mobilitalea sp.]
MKSIQIKFNWKKIVKWLVIIIVVVTVGNFAFQRVIAKRATPTEAKTVTSTVKVETRDIETALSSSGTIQPLNTYQMKTLVEGEITAADFKEGDDVKQGQVLYQIATDNLDNQINDAQKSIERSEKDLEKAKSRYDEAESNYKAAQSDYNDAVKEYGDPNVKADISGVVKKLFVKEGDRLQNGGQIAEIYDNSYMLLKVPFSSSDVSSSLIGKTAEVTVDDSFETLIGKVTAISESEEVLSGNRLVKQVTIRVKNPGGLTEQTTATASIGSLYSSEEETFSVCTDEIMTTDLTGKIASLKIEEGSKISAGSVIMALDQKSIDDQLDTYSKAVQSAKDAMDNASDSIDTANAAIEDAKSKLQDINDTKTDYSITAPVAGKIITKDALVGDTINNQSALCTLYDLSAVTFQMNIDELDVMKVKVGQEVNITADALPGKTFKGSVTNISLASTTNQGVTQYPVTVRIDDVGNLLPGMNVTGKIILEKATGVIAIPSDALMRGDVVYVKDPSVTEAVGRVPAGFKEVKVETGI